MRRLTALLLFLTLGLLATSSLACSRRGATVTAFGESMGRGVPEMVQYYDRVAAALDQYLKSLGFSVTTEPAAVGESGVSFVAQRDTWYQGSYRGTPAFYVKVRQPTENSTGLHVYVCWRAEGSAGYVDSVEAGANAFRAQLTEWWERYQRENPRPGTRNGE